MLVLPFAREIQAMLSFVIAASCYDASNDDNASRDDCMGVWSEQP